VAATLLHPATPGNAVTAAGPHLTTAPSTTPVAATQPADFKWPPTGIHVRVYPAEEEKVLAAGWTRHLTQTFGTVVSAASQVAVQPWGGEAGGDIATGQDYMDTFVKFTIHGVPTSMAIQVAAPGQYSLSPTRSCLQSTSPDKCVFTPTADGGLLLYFDIVQGGGDVRLRSVTDFRPDGTVVFATGYNYDPTSSAQHGQLSVPLTDTQLTTFATDPLLAF
jgi:hypothetical protein